MFVAGDPDTASRPAIFSMPGQGEHGVNDLSKLVVYGPHYWLNNGWDGGVQESNGKHYPILFTSCYINNQYPSAIAYYNLLTLLLNTYHVKRNSVHLCGLSQGAFTSGALIMFEQTAGAETGMKMVTTLTCFEGTPDPLPSPYSTWSRGFTAYKVWAKKYGGRYFYLEGSGTDNFRDGWQYADAMNDSVPNSAYFSYEDLGGGAHCCWNSMYNPSATNWTCAPATALGPNNAPSQTGTNVMGDYTAPSSVFQWMLQHGDTSLVLATPATPGTPVANAGSTQTITLPTSTATLTGSGSETNGTIASYAWSQTGGPSTATITTPGQAQTTITGLAQGTYTFQLTVTDALGVTATASIQITVNAAPVIPTLPANVMKQVVVAEYRTWYITQDGKVWAYNNNSPLPVQFPIGGLKADTGAGGFNYFRILDEQGYVWTSKTDYTTNTTRIDTDTTGAAFGGNWYIDAYGHTGLTIRADSSVWYFGMDVFSLFYPGGNSYNAAGTTMAPARLSPAGMKFKKVLFGGSSILGLTTTGQVYQWSSGGSRTPTLIATPRPATDIFISRLSVFGCIIPDPGETSGMGYPYIWGSACTMWGGSANYTTPTSVKALWNMTSPIKEISVDWNTIHYIDSLGNMYGGGYNSSGEVGNGQEFVGKYTYPGWPNYGWSFTDYENPTGIPKQIGAGVKWKHLYSNNWFGFYKYAMDENDSIYSWGRNKSLALGNGFWNGYNGGQYHANTLDVIRPTMVHPMTSIFTEYDYEPPTMTMDPKRVLSTSTATLTGVAKPLKCVAVIKPAPNGIDTAGYKIVSYLWTKVSGPAGGTLASPNAATTSVSGLTTGTYIFNLLATDNNTGTISGNDTIVVTSVVPGPITVSAGSNQTITLPTNSVTLTGTASEVNGTIASYAWSQLSGPSTATITTPTQATTSVTGLIQGVYRFQLLVTDALGTTATATVQVTVNPAPVVPGPPSANAGSDQTITLPTSSATLTGSGSETNGTIVGYQWTQISGPSTATITASGAATTSVTGLVQGVYVFQLKVTDNSGVTATDQTQVTVNPAAPVPGTPSANAGSDQTITLPTNSATLTGSGTESNGTIVGYQWTQVSGPSTATITSANAATTSVTGLVQGVYVFQLKVTDNSGVTATDQTQVTVNPAPPVPGAPSANAGSDQTITLPTSSATLSGSGSETNGTIVGYQWTQVSGPSAATITSASSATTSVTGLVQGVYVFQLLVTDNSGVTATDQTQVTVNPAVPVPGTPSADAGADQIITLPTNSVSLTGSGSETNGTIVGYQWTQVSGPSTATITTSHQATTSVTGLVAGIYRFKLTVTDNSGVTASATMQVTVNAAVVVGPPSANAGADQTITLPTNSVSLTGSGTETNGTITGYQWTQVSGPSTATITTSGQAATTVTGLVEGIYRFKLTVTDNSGVTASATMQVTVNPAPVVAGPPTANAGGDQTITLPTNSVTLSGSGSETNGTITGYQWTQVSGPSTATITTSGQATTTVTGLVQGTYRFKLTVTDNSGVTASATMQVTVNPAAVVSGPPSANAGGDQTITLPTNSVTLTGSGTESNGTIVSYAWVKTSGPAPGAITTPGQAQTTVTGLVQGVYTFQLTVTDNSGVTATDVITVTVNPDPTPVNQSPVAVAGPNQTTSSPSVALDGSASYDPDGTITKYSWIQTSGAGGVTITGSNTATPSINGLTSGVYTFMLTVTDNAGATGSSSVTITVTLNSVLTAVAGNDTTVYFPNANAAVLNGTASYDPGGTITGYTWAQVSGPTNVAISAGNTAIGAVSGLAVGDYVFQLTVTNNSGSTSSATVTVHVKDNERTTATSKLYPNPVPSGQQFVIEGTNSYLGKVTFVLRDIQGRIVKMVTMDKQEPNYSQAINVYGLGRGTYILFAQFYLDEKPLVLKVIVD